MVITDVANTAVGDQALVNNTGNLNTATGFGSLSGNTTGNDNTANGAFALISNTTGEFNNSRRRSFAPFQCGWGMTTTPLAKARL